MTGIPTLQLFYRLVEYICKYEAKEVKFVMPVEERVCLTLMRLKLDISFAAIAVLFKCTSQSCINYFYNMIPKLYDILKVMIYIPALEIVRMRLPKCFEKYKNTRLVLDCTEIPIEKPKCLNCRILSYSFYKGTNTVKYLIGVTPSGYIGYVSVIYGGRASDKAIFVQSKLLDNLEPFVDALMVDKGFLIDKECDNVNIKLIRPPFLKKKPRFSESEAEDTQNIACARVHVERQIGRKKIYKILCNKIPVEFLPIMDKIIVIISGVTNLSAPLFTPEKFI
jgi:hypothetical protein